MDTGARLGGKSENGVLSAKAQLNEIITRGWRGGSSRRVGQQGLSLTPTPKGGWEKLQAEDGWE